MGQVDIFEWLAKRRLSGEHNYFSVKEVTKQMCLGGLRPAKVRESVSRLDDFGFLDMDKGWPKKFRAKLKIVNILKLQNKEMFGFK